jgi:hypothetical protein
MTVKYVRFIEGALLTGTVASYYTAPTAPAAKAVIKKLTFCNNSSDKASLTVYLVAAGDTPGTKNLLVESYVLAANATFDCFAALLHVLEPGDMIQALSSVDAAINIMASGMEIQ